MKPLMMIFASTGYLLASIAHTPGGAICSSHPCTLAVTCPGASCASTDIQTAINEAQLGDTITIEAGKVWTSTGLTLYRKTAGAGVVTIRSSTPDAQLPAPDVRITPAYKALLPELRLTNGNKRLVQVEQTSNAVEHYLFLGIWFSAAEGLSVDPDLIRLWVAASAAGTLAGVTGASNTSPVTLSMSTTAGFSSGDHVMVTGVNGNAGANGWFQIANLTATTMDLIGSTGTGGWSGGGTVTLTSHWDASQTPNDITFDRCLFLLPALSTSRQAIRVAGRNITIKNSYCDQIKQQNDSQCISMPSTPGPVTITNNYLGGGPGETIMTGGTIPNLPNQMATDITITHNVLYKDPALYKNEDWAAATWVRKGKTIKHAGVSYIAVTSGVTGMTLPVFPGAVCADPFNPDVGCSVTDGGVIWQRTWFANSTRWTMKNLLEFKTANRATVKWNTLDGAWPDAQTGVALVVKAENQGTAYDWTARTEHVEFAHNVIRNAAEFAIVINPGSTKDGVTSDINIHDNLTYRMKVGVSGAYYFLRTWPRAATPPHFTGLRLVHNTLESAPDTYMWWSIGTGANKYDAPVFTDNLFSLIMKPGGIPLQCFICPATTVTNKAALDNAAVGGSYTFLNNVLPGENLTNWPAGNFNTAWGSLGFINPAGGDYTLPQASPYKGAGLDGKDLGADTSQLPQIRNLSIVPTASSATLSWSLTAPEVNQPCSIEAGANRDFSDTIADLNPVTFMRPDATGTGASRVFTLGQRVPLAPGTTYWYRLHCGGAFEAGSFTTTSGSGAPPPSPSPAPGIYINAGGPNYTDSQNVLWSADQYFAGGSTFSTSTPISGGAPLYQTSRYGNFSYTVPVAGGTYNVVLKFAEPWWTSAGSRLFNVAINGQTVLSNFDIVAQAGGAFIALDRQFTVNAASGRIDIQFTSVKDYAAVSGIALLPQGGAAAPPPPPAPSIIYVNSGGSNYTDPQNAVWSADANYAGGSTFSTTHGISGTNSAPLYQFMRYGNFSYSFPVVSGSYKVVLKFVEPWWTSVNSRIFNVTINGQTVLSNFDIFAQAGGAFIALDRQFTVNAANGRIEIQFTSVKDNAVVSAIEISP